MGGWTSFLVRKVRASLKLVGALGLLTPFAASVLILPSFHTLAEFICTALLDCIEHPFISTPAFIFLICNLIVLAIIITSIMGRPYKKIVPYNFIHLPFKPIETISFTSNQYIEEAPPLSEDTTSRFGPHACPQDRHTHRITTNSFAIARSNFPRCHSHQNLSSHQPAVKANLTTCRFGPAYPQDRHTHRVTTDSIAVARSNFPRSRSQQNLSSHQPAVKANSTLFRSPSHSTYLNMKAAAPTDSNYLTDAEVNQRFSAFIEYRFATMKKETMD